jgi:hypothetical protein
MHRKNESWFTRFAFFLYKLSKRAEDSNRARGSLLGSLLKVVMTLAGFTCLTLAGFTLSMIAGLIVAGVSCFLLAWLYGSDESENASVH